MLRQKQEHYVIVFGERAAFLNPLTLLKIFLMIDNIDFIATLENYIDVQQFKKMLVKRENEYFLPELCLDVTISYCRRACNKKRSLIYFTH